MSLSLSGFPSYRFGEGIRSAEAERRANNEKARNLAAESQKRPLEDEDISVIKDAIKQRIGTRPRFNGKEQLLDILETLQDNDENTMEDGT